MIEINLLPEELRKRQSVQITLPELPDKKTILKAVAVFFAFQFLVLGIALFQKMELGLARAELKKLSANTKELVERKKEIAVMRERIKDIRGLTQRKYHWASVLNSLTRSMTKGVWLRAVSIETPIEAKTKSKKSASERKSVGKSKKSSQSSSSSESEHKLLKRFKIEGSVIASGQETAYVGKFIKALQEDKYLTGLFSDITLSHMDQRKVKDYNVFDFVLYGEFRREKA